MRPPEFTGGNALALAVARLADQHAASMRPPEFTGGNWGQSAWDAVEEMKLQ